MFANTSTNTSRGRARPGHVSAFVQTEEIVMSGKKSDDTNKLANERSGAWTDMRPLSIASEPAADTAGEPKTVKINQADVRPPPGISPDNWDGGEPE